MGMKKYLDKIGRRKDNVSSYVNRIERMASKNECEYTSYANFELYHAFERSKDYTWKIRGKQGIEDIFLKIVSYILAHHKSPTANQVENWVERLRKK